MLLHLPIVLLTTLSPIPISDTVPQFAIAKECSFESEGSAESKLCTQEETAALAELKKKWPQFVASEKSNCLLEEKRRIHELRRTADLSGNGARCGRCT